MYENVRFKRTKLHRVEKVGYKALLDSTQPNVPECLEILRFLTTHSKLLSTRNDSGITPKGPMGPWVPWPLGAEGALGPLGHPLVMAAWRRAVLKSTILDRFAWGAWRV